MPNLKEHRRAIAGFGLAAASQRPARYEVKTQPRRRPDNVKDRIVREREFDVLRLQSEEVAEFDYRPTACQHDVPHGRGSQEHLEGEGRAGAVPEVRYFFYITNERELDAGRGRVRGQ